MVSGSDHGSATIKGTTKFRDEFLNKVIIKLEIGLGILYDGKHKCSHPKLSKVSVAVIVLVIGSA